MFSKKKSSLKIELRFIYFRRNQWWMIKPENDLLECTVKLESHL